MEKDNVAITIQSHQRIDGRAEGFSQRCEGRLRPEGEGFLLTYREDRQAGLGETETRLLVEGDRLTLTRRGETRCVMVFQPGKRSAALYQTPYGEIPMELEALSLKTQLSRAGGRVDLHYRTVLDHGPAGEIRLRLTIRQKENETYD